MKHFISSLSVLCANTPPCKGRVSSRKILSLLLILFLSIGNVWGAELEVIETLNLSESKTINETPITVGDVLSITGTKGTNNFPVFNYNASSGTDLRFYKGSSCSVKFTAKEGYKLEKIVFKKNETTVSELSNFSVDNGTLTDNEWTASGSSESVTFTYNHGENFNKQIYKIYVTYSSTSSGGGETPVTISLNKTELNLQEGATETLTATVTGSAETVSWSSSATDVASVDNTGKVTAVAAGEATITAAIGDVKATCEVTVTAATTPDPEPGTGGETTTVTYVFKDDPNCPGDAGDWFSGTIDEYTGWTATKGTNNPKYYDSGTGLRVYNGGKFTITSTKVMTSITLTFAGTSHTFSTSNTTTPQTVTPNAKSYEWSVSRTCRLQKIEITYAADAGGSEEPTPSVSVAPTSHTFATTNVGETATQVFEITAENTTETLSAEISNTTDYAISAIADNKITVTYQPQTAETHEATLTIKAGDEASTTVALTGKAVAALEGTWVLVTDASSLKAGDEIIIASKDENYALSTTQNGNNRGQVEITKTDNTITATTEAQVLTLQAGNKENTLALYTGDGYLYAASSSDNYLRTETTLSDNSSWSIAVAADGTATLIAQGTNTRNTLYYNKNSKIFSCYSTAQQSIVLYKKASKYTVTIADCTNGTVSAKMGETALATNDQVFSGTTITLSNTPATDYKLSVYDIYKTDDATTKVTETDGKFIMPEFDVTISATFELAKTLTGIEITNNATQTTFWQGETFNYEGLKVTAHFDGAADEDVTDKVTVTGSTATAGAAVEVTVSFTEGTVTQTTNYNITVKATANTQGTAYDVATAREIIDKVSTADNVYVTGIVSEIVTAYNSQYGNISYNISADGLTTSDQLLAYRGKSYNGENFTSDDDIQVGDEVVVKGNLKLYEDTYEFDADNQLVSLNRTKQQAGLSYTTTEYNVNLGEAFTAPTLNNPHSLAVTYSSNNEDVATVVATDGAVTIKAAGTVVITASFAGDDDYVAGSASYTINITDPSVSEATFVAGTDKSEELSISKDGVTVEFTSGTFSRDDNYRCYANQSMTISYADGNITKIVIECTANDGAEYGPGQFTTETATYSYSGKVGTWTGEANSVTFTNIKQVRMTAITVYYKQDTRTPAGLAWNPATISLTVGDAFTAPTFSNPNSLTGITFASDNEALATVNNTGSISLVSGKTGTATITATYAGNVTYKPAEVTCVITVSPKTENVVILAQLEGQWYAMTGAYVSGKTNVLSAIPVEYINGTLYNVAEADKASVEWQLAIDGTVATFKNGDNYLTGGTDTDLTLETTEFEWDYNGVNYLCNDGKRTFLYCENTKTNVFGFKNYAISNAGSVKSNSDGTTESYSSTPVVTAPVYETATFYTRTVTPGNYGTICLPYASDNFTGATFFKVAGKEGNKIVFDEVTALEAGKPYIFLAEATEIKVAQIGESAVEAGKSNSLQGTFSEIEPAENNILTGNYMVVNNVIKKCGANCGLAANRAYFVATELESLVAAPAPAPSVRRISMGVTGQNTATGVDQIQGDEVPTKMIINGQLFILRGEKMYDAQGKLVK